LKKETIMKELRELDRLKDILTKSIKEAPAGRIRSEMAQGKYPQFYVIREEDRAEHPKGVYIKKADMPLARALAQKEYDLMVLEAIEKREKELYFLLGVKEHNEIHTIINNLSCAKRTLVEPCVLSDSDFVLEWEQKRRGEENRFPIRDGFLTEKGETVRSKSEKIIADKLYMKGIPYKYEAGLWLNSGKLVFPDFTILNIRTREEIYLEHFGMMDNPEYCKAAAEKLEMYEDNGIYPGDRLLITMESSLKPISIKQIDNLIENYLKQD